MRKPSTTETEVIEAAKEAMQETDPGTPAVELMTEAAVTTGSLGPQDKPAALTVEGVLYVYMPEIDGYASDEGDLLDLKTKPAVKALFAWRRAREELRAVEAANAEREAGGPDDLHLLQIEPDRPQDYREFELGRRWCNVKDLSPGATGNEGVRLEHGVVVRFAPEVGDDGKAMTPEERSKSIRLLHYRVAHIDDRGMVSLEPGERLRENAVVFYPKPYVFEWLKAVSQHDNMTLDRWCNKLVHQAYAISDLRTGQAAGSGIAGKVGANASVQHDLEAGRRARAQG